MTADERIEGMLNQLGQTMATMPAPVFENVEGRDANVLMAYEYPDRYNAVRVALKWHILNNSPRVHCSQPFRITFVIWWM